MLSLYPSQAPMTLTQMRRNADGRFVIDGIKVEFHENGRLKYFADMSKGN